MGEPTIDQDELTRVKTDLNALSNDMNQIKSEMTKLSEMMAKVFDRFAPHGILQDTISSYDSEHETTGDAVDMSTTEENEKILNEMVHRIELESANMYEPGADEIAVAEVVETNGNVNETSNDENINESDGEVPIDSMYLQCDEEMYDVEISTEDENPEPEYFLSTIREESIEESPETSILNDVVEEADLGSVKIIEGTTTDENINTSEDHISIQNESKVIYEIGEQLTEILDVVGSNDDAFDIETESGIEEIATHEDHISRNDSKAIDELGEQLTEILDVDGSDDDAYNVEESMLNEDPGVADSDEEAVNSLVDEIGLINENRRRDGEYALSIEGQEEISDNEAIELNDSAVDEKIENSDGEEDFSVESEDENDSDDEDKTVVYVEIAPGSEFKEVSEAVNPSDISDTETKLEFGQFLLEANTDINAEPKKAENNELIVSLRVELLPTKSVLTLSRERADSPVKPELMLHDPEIEFLASQSLIY